tara:strand:+ start:2516 stop:2845 length:330 start_codon:yes stop_codon:yes gene_type:complete
MSNDEDVTIRVEIVEYLLNIINIQDPYTIDEEEIDEISDTNLTKLLNNIDYLNSNQNEYECSICLESNEKDNCFGKLPCNHIFHVTCILQWGYKKNTTCPICRAIIFNQ